MTEIISYKTAVFQIHNPSNRKKAILKNMLLKAHVGYSHTLRHWLPSEQKIQELLLQPKSDRRVYLQGQGNAIDRYVRQKFPILSNSCKFGVKEDVVAQIKAYVELCETQTGYSRAGKAGAPTVQPISKNHQDFIDYSIYEHFITCTDLDTENTLRYKTSALRKQGKIRPAEIPKSDISAGFSLLYCPDNGKYYAYINTHTKKCRFAKPANIKLPLTILSGNKKGTVLPFKNGYTITAKTGILLPLAFGKDFQYDAFIAQGTARTAKLVHITERHNKPVDIYELHIAFEFKTEKIEPVTYLGVERGIYDLATITVVDKNGHVLESQHIDGKQLRSVQKQKSDKNIRNTTRQAITDEITHKTANAIIALAIKHKSQIVIENLKNLAIYYRNSKQKMYSHHNKMLTRQHYTQLGHILEYKCKLHGLPKPYAIHPAYMDRLCPKCGSTDTRNKTVDDGTKISTFKCVPCGYTTHADVNTSRNIALKGYFYNQVYENPSADDKKKTKQLLTDFIKSFIMDG